MPQEYTLIYQRSDGSIHVAPVSIPFSSREQVVEYVKWHVRQEKLSPRWFKLIAAVEGKI